MFTYGTYISSLSVNNNNIRIKGSGIKYTCASNIITPCSFVMPCDVLLDWMVLISCLVVGNEIIENIFQLVILVLVLYTLIVERVGYQYVYLFSENQIRVFPLHLKLLQHYNQLFYKLKFCIKSKGNLGTNMCLTRSNK